MQYLIEQDSQVVPVEVKSGSIEKMQRMHLFIDEKKHPWESEISFLWHMEYQAYIGSSSEEEGLIMKSFVIE